MGLYTNAANIRLDRAMRKMAPGSMSGQSRVCSLPSGGSTVLSSSQQQGEDRPLCPVIITPDGFTLGHGTINEASGLGTKAASLSNGFTVLTVWDDTSFIAPGATPDCLGFTRFSWPDLTFLSHHRYKGDTSGDVTPVNHAVDETGAVYFWDQSGSSALLVRQVLDDWDVLNTAPLGFHDGLTYNPYDGTLYDLIPGGGGTITQYSTDGTVMSVFTGLETSSDIVTCTPDGALWFERTDYPQAPGQGSGLYRLHPGTSTIEYRTWSEIHPIHWTASPIPTWGLANSTNGSVVYRALGPDGAPENGFGIVVDADFSVSITDCDPFQYAAPYYGIGTARVTTSGFNGNSRTLFLWPTSSGFGYYLWYIGP